MNLFSILEVKVGKSLTARRHIVVLTHQKPSILSNKGLDEETVASCNHVTIYKAKRQDEEVERLKLQKCLKLEVSL